MRRATVRRRDFISVLGCAALWPARVLAQNSSTVRRVGVLFGLPSSDPAGQAEYAALVSGLKEFGWAEGRNLRLEVRWPGPDQDRIRAAAKEIAALKPDVIVTRTTPVTIAMRSEVPATTPIVFVVVAEPIASGLVKNESQPGGNLTGFTNFEAAVSGKWLELLKAVAPQLSHVALMYNPKSAPFAPAFMRDAERPARTLSLETVSAPVSGQGEIEATMRGIAAKPGGGLVTLTDMVMTENRDLIIALAAVHRIPAIYANSNFARHGGLMAYSPDTADLFHRAASYVDRVLRGAKPGDLPVQQPAKYELIVNLKTARSLGITVPPALLSTADEVIE